VAIHQRAISIAIASPHSRHGDAIGVFHSPFRLQYLAAVSHEKKLARPSRQAQTTLFLRMVKFDQVIIPLSATLNSLC
jgi:hypothetical protein